VPVTCDICGGGGMISRTVRSLLGNVMTQSPCGSCRGFGTVIATPCTSCQGAGRVRARRTVDLTGQLGIELRVRGSGRQFEVELDDGVRGYGRMVSRRAPFRTSAEWTVVRVPFSALRSTIFGRAVDAPVIDVARIRGVGLYMVDGQDGPFKLEVDYMRSYGAGIE
jgi:hypothetical protein